MKILLTLTILVTSTLSLGNVVEFVGTASTENISGVNISVYPEAKIKQLDGSMVTAKLSGSGIRKVNVVFVSVNVYHIASYVMYPEKLKLPNAMEGIQASPTRLLKLTLLRNLSGQEIRTSFEQALEHNGVDITHASFVKMMEQIEGTSTSPGQTVLFGATPGKSEERIFVELPNKKFEDETKGLSTDMWKIWFNKPVDAPMKELQKLLVGKSQPGLDFEDSYDLEAI